jgi:hypothetical protein
VPADPALVPAPAVAAPVIAGVNHQRAGVTGAGLAMFRIGEDHNSQSGAGWFI